MSTTTEQTTIKLLASLLSVGVKSKSQLAEIEKIVGLTFSKDDIAEAKVYNSNSNIDGEAFHDLHESNHNLNLMIDELNLKLDKADETNKELTIELARLTSTRRSEPSEPTESISIKPILLNTECLIDIPEEVATKGTIKLVKIGTSAKGDLYTLSLPVIKEIIVKGVNHQVDLDEIKEIADRLPDGQHISGITNAQVLTLAELA